jgi:regulatory protein
VIISAIVQKRQKRYEIQVDGEPMLSVHEDVLVKYGLHKGMEINPDDLTAIAVAQERHYIVQALYRYLSYRPRTVKEARDYLLQKGFAPTLVDAVLVEMEKEGYLNDQQYAINWVRERQVSKQLGIQRLRQELIRKGIAAVYIDAALDESRMEAERQLVTEVAKRRYSRMQGLDWPTIERRLGGYLLRRGFASSLVHQTLRHIRQQRDEGEELV